MGEITIKTIAPRAALPGGDVDVEYSGTPLLGTTRLDVRFGDVAGQITVATSTHIIVRIPEALPDQGSHEVFIINGEDSSQPFTYEVGRKLASNLHPVGNPAVGPDGNTYVTYSGGRGQKTPVSVYKVTPRGAVTPFVTDIMNATSLAFSLSGDLFVSSRHEGNVYHVNPEGKVETFVEGMGVATGIAFDRDENLYVGDRSGTVFKISPSKEIFVFATLEPSIAAYHLAFGFDDNLYINGPTTSSFDSIYRISPSGDVSRFFTGLGRPQGLAFDIEGSLYAVASYRGKRGIFRFCDPQNPELIVAGVSLVGLAFDHDDNLMVVDSVAGSASGSLYKTRIGVGGKPLP